MLETQKDDDNKISRSTNKLDEWSPGNVLFKEYEIVRLLGRGGAGAVYLVRHVLEGNLLALKAPHAGLSQRSQRLFFREIRTWIDIPDHPHLTAYRFFRTLDDRILIFSEYVEGGALNDWISQKRLLKIPDILDVCIQFAWGLHAVHVCGVVHQDIKPANVLMTNDGIVKLADFGLARVHELLGSPQPERKQTKKKSRSVSSGIMTPAYCSPEQSQGRKLNHKTDIWSFGLSVLSMFVGDPKWYSGGFAQDALRAYYKNKPLDPYPEMPESVLKILQKCFQFDTEKRWDNMLQIATHLKDAYREIAGKEYERPEPHFNFTSLSEVTEENLSEKSNSRTPVEWMAFAMKAAGREQTQINDIIPRREGSRTAQVLLDIEILEEAHIILKTLFDKGRHEFCHDLVNLLVDKASSHYIVDDRTGADEIYDYICRLIARSGSEEMSIEEQSDLATVYMNKSTNLWFLGKYQASADFNEKAIVLLENQIYNLNIENKMLDLTSLYENKALALWSLKKLEVAIQYYDKAIKINESYLLNNEKTELQSKLALNYMNKANALWDLKNNLEAIRFHDKAIAIFEELIFQKGIVKHSNLLGKTYMNKANALMNQNLLTEAVEFHDKAISIYIDLIQNQGKSAIRRDLALVYLNKASAMWSLKKLNSAIEIIDKAIVIFRRLIFIEGRSELMHLLGYTYLNRAQFQKDILQKDDAESDYRKGAKIWEWLMFQNPGKHVVMHFMLGINNIIAQLIETGRFQELVKISGKSMKTFNALNCKYGTDKSLPYIENAMRYLLLNRKIGKDRLRQQAIEPGNSKEIQKLEKIITDNTDAAGKEYEAFLNLSSAVK